MNIIHITADGTVRNSVKGVVIQNKEFYRVLNDIQKKAGVKQCHT